MKRDSWVLFFLEWTECKNKLGFFFFFKFLFGFHKAEITGWLEIRYPSPVHPRYSQTNAHTYSSYSMLFLWLVFNWKELTLRPHWTPDSLRNRRNRRGRSLTKRTGPIIGIASKSEITLWAWDLHSPST